MQKETIQLVDKKLMGLCIRTSYDDEFNSGLSKIGALIARYFSENVAEKIPGRKRPGVQFSAYTNYETNEYGAYDYFFGEEVLSLDVVPEGLDKLIVPAGKYLKLTTSSGPMPQVVINAWQNIWKMSGDELGGVRDYRVDFELYDERAANPNNVSLDIFLGVR